MEGMLKNATNDSAETFKSFFLFKSRRGTPFSVDVSIFLAFRRNYKSVSLEKLLNSVSVEIIASF